MVLGLVRAAALLIVGGSVLGCSASPPGTSLEPTLAAGTPSAASPMVAAGTPSVASPTLAAGTPLPTSPASTDPFATIGLQIDARRVISAAGIECTGGVMGGESSDTYAYEVWTLHCPAGSGAGAGPRKLVDALRGEVERLGATIEDEGEVGSFNDGNFGDAQVTLHYQFKGVESWIRVTFLKQGDGSSMVVTIDHQLLESP